MKKYGVSSDWLAKRSNSLRQSAYSLSSVKSNTIKLDAMIKSASAKPIRSNRKLSFVEVATSEKVETDKENTDPSMETDDKKTDEEEEKEEEEEPKDTIAASTTPVPYELSSEVDEDKDDELSPTSKEFSLRIPRIDLPQKEKKRSSKQSSPLVSSSSDDEAQPETPKPKLKKKMKKETTVIKKATGKRSSKKKSKDEQPATEAPQPSPEQSDEDEKPIADDDKKLSDEDEPAKADDTKKAKQKKDKTDQEQARVEHLKKLLRISGIRLMIKRTELDELSSQKAKIKYLKSLFDKAGYTGNLSIKDCQKFREKRDTEKELLEIQQSAVDVKGIVKGGRTLRGQGQARSEPSTISKRKREPSSEVDENIYDMSSADEKPTVKKRRVLQMEASPEVSDNE